MVKRALIKKNIFPLVDAILLTPKEGEKGAIGICTNTSSSGQVYGEIEKRLRRHTSVLGSLIVNRDGAERMILNSLAHPTLRYLVLFSEESLTFSPSTNLLQALKNGFDKSRTGNYINGGLAASPHYPNLDNNIIDIFRKEITVLPLFMFKSAHSRRIINEYLEWLRSKVDGEIYRLLKETNNREKIYYDSLNKIVDSLADIKTKPKGILNLDTKDFQHLQLPKMILKDKKILPSFPFRVTRSESKIRLDAKIGNDSFFIKSDDDFLLSYSLMKFLGAKKEKLNPTAQLFLGAELGRVKTEITNNIKFPSFVKNRIVKGGREAPLEPNVSLRVDKKYYYRVSAQKGVISVACLAYDVCEKVFELRSKTAGVCLRKLGELDRFEEYEMDILHRLDIGAQIGRAAVAAKRGYNFIQDFDIFFKINTKNLPLLISESDSFLDNHKNILRKIYTAGLTETHGDKGKGLARTAAALVIYRDTKKALATLPSFYKQGVENTLAMREEYKKQLLRFDHDGSYSYGQRTRSFFGFDQLENTVKMLKKNPGRAAIIQRFDPLRDMMIYQDGDNKETKFSHDPCLTHDIFFILGGKLNSFHIARAHNMVNAYPENIFGLYDGYVSFIADRLKIQEGDMYMLSNRANILLLTEEQRVKKILAEPSKPPDDLNKSSGPYQLGNNTKRAKKQTGVFYISEPIKKVVKKPKSKTLGKLENYNGVNILDKAIDYLKIRGGAHNNPILCEYDPRAMDSQGDYLIFFQANIMGKRLHATAVFVNHSVNRIKEDLNLCNYIATRYTNALKCQTGYLTIFYVSL